MRYTDANEVAAAYGLQVDETMSFDEIKALQDSVDHSDEKAVSWADPNLKRILRFRIVGFHPYDSPWWDVSYCYGELKDGSRVMVRLPFHQLRGRFWQNEVIEYAKRDKVYAKGLGFFDPSVYSTLAG